MQENHGTQQRSHSLSGMASQGAYEKEGFRLGDG
jgi:hypothetical protein